MWPWTPPRQRARTLKTDFSLFLSFQFFPFSTSFRIPPLKPFWGEVSPRTPAKIHPRRGLALLRPGLELRAERQWHRVLQVRAPDLHLGDGEDAVQSQKMGVVNVSNSNSSISILELLRAWKLNGLNVFVKRV